MSPSGLMTRREAAAFLHMDEVAFARDVQPTIAWIGSGRGMRTTQEELERWSGPPAAIPYHGWFDALTPPLQCRESRVYFIQSGLSGPIKIGVSTDIESRIASMQVGSPDILRLLAAVPGNADDERALHKRFAAHHYRGEWFKPSVHILRSIAAIHEQAWRAEGASP